MLTTTPNPHLFFMSDLKQAEKVAKAQKLKWRQSKKQKKGGN